MIEMSEESRELVAELSSMTGLDSEQVSKMLNRIAEANDGREEGLEFHLDSEVAQRAPPGWPSLSKGELVDVKGILLEVMGMQSGLLLLKPRGPSSALIRRLANPAKKEQR